VGRCWDIQHLENWGVNTTQDPTTETTPGVRSKGESRGGNGGVMGRGGSKVVKVTSYSGPSKFFK